jgi:carboxyl-terminal processing protease
MLPDQYSEIETGERDQDYHMPWTQIKPASYTKWTGLQNFDQIVQKETNTVSNDPDFKIVKEEADELKKQHDETIEPLNFDKFEKLEKTIQEKNKQFEELHKKETGLKIRSLIKDTEEMKGDTGKIVRNANWIKGLTKDIDLKEAVHAINLINGKQ